MLHIRSFCKRPVRLAALVILAAAPLVATRTATAISFEVTELTGCTAPASRWDCLGYSPSPGQSFTIGIRIRSLPGESIIALGASAWGYDGATVGFTSGSAVSSIFHDFAFPGVGAFGGLMNRVAGALSESSIGGAGNRVQIFLGLAGNVRPHTENPLDPGLDGVLGGGDAQIRVRFLATAPGAFQIRIGTGYQGDGAVVDASGLVEQTTSAIVGGGMSGLYVVVVPEPTTTLLLGSGLAALAARRRSSGPASA